MISNDTVQSNENIFSLSTRILMLGSLVCICILGVVGKLDNSIGKSYHMFMNR